MASTFTLNSQTYDGRYLQVSLTQTKDAANRRSIITGTVKSLAGESAWYATGPTTVNVAGTQRYSRARESDDIGQSYRNFVGTISEFYISHDTAGNASVSLEIITAIYVSATQSKTATWTLDSIGAATTAAGAPTACSVNQTVAAGWLRRLMFPALIPGTAYGRLIRWMSIPMRRSATAFCVRFPLAQSLRCLLSLRPLRKAP